MAVSPLAISDVTLVMDAPDPEPDTARITFEGGTR
jgi:hypothetical protein